MPPLPCRSTLLEGVPLSPIVARLEGVPLSPVVARLEGVSLSPDVARLEGGAPISCRSTPRGLLYGVFLCVPAVVPGTR